MSAEHLVCVAIIRNGTLHKGHHLYGHYGIRQALGDTNPSEHQLLDEDGFVTNTGRFVNRAEGLKVAVAAGQTEDRGQVLLSSDVNWNVVS